MSIAADALADQSIALSSGHSIEDALSILRESHVDVLPVLDDQGRMEGVFSLPILMKNLLPVSVPVGGIDIDVRISAAPGIAKRLAKMQVLHVGDLMDRRAPSIPPGVPLWEAISLLMQTGSPLFVVDEGTRKLLGLVTYQSAFDQLSRMKD
jgi:CBS domain-containing protein